MEEIIFDFISKYITLTEQEEKDFISLNTFKSVKKGTILLKEGELSNENYFVLKGCLRIFYLVDGEEKTTAFYAEMEGVNPQCAIDNKPSNYYISCVEDCILTVGNPEMEALIYEKFPKFETLFRKLSTELTIKSQISFDEFKTTSKEQRYLKLQESRPDLIQRIPQLHLASFLGMTPQSLSRIRKRVLIKNKS